MPSRLTWLTLLLGAFFVSVPFSLSAAQPRALSLQQIVASLDSTSPVLAEAQTNLSRARSAYTGSRAFPNPSVFGSQESLNDDAGTTERIIGVRQSLGFLWSQASKHGSAKSAYEAAQAEYVEAKRELIVRVLAQAYEFDRLQRQSELMDSVLMQSEHLSKATAARRDLGDIAPYDEQRFVLEKIQLQNHKQELQQEVANALSELIRLTGLSSASFQMLELTEPPSTLFKSEDEAVSYALLHRAELTRSEQALDAAHKAVAQTRWNQLPDLSLGIGDKTVDPGPSGLYIEAEVEIPLWSQRRSETNVARSELAQAEIQHRSQRQLVEQQVRSAFRQLQLAEQINFSLNGSLEDSANVNMQRGVRLYLEGEMSALELVDALRTGIDAQDAALRLRNSLAIARAELRRVAGLEPLEN